MKKIYFTLLSLLFLAIFSQSAWAIPAYVRGTSVSASVATNTASFASNTAGDLILVGSNTANSGGYFENTPTDTIGNTYILIATAVGSTSTAQLWYAANCKASAGTNTVSVTENSGGSSFNNLQIAEYSGASKTSPLRTSNNNLGASGTSANTGSMTTVSGDLVIGWIWNNNNLTAGTNYTLRTSGVWFGLEDYVTPNTTENPSATWTGSSEWTAIGADFIPTTAASSTTSLINGVKIYNGTTIY